MPETPMFWIVLGVVFLSIIPISGAIFYFRRRKLRRPSDVEGQFEISSSANLVDLETVPSQKEEWTRDVEDLFNNRVTGSEASSSVDLVKSESNSCEKDQLPSSIEGSINKETTRSRASSPVGQVDLETVPSQGDESHRDIEGLISNRVTGSEASSSVDLVKSESNSCEKDQLPSSIEGSINKEMTRSRASSPTGQADLRSESTQIQDIPAPPAILVAFVPHSKRLFAMNPMKLGKDGSKQDVHINPQLQLCVEDQMVEININEEGETIKPCLNDLRSRDPAAGAFQKSHKSVDNMDGLFIDKFGQVVRVFYHEGIDKSIIKQLEDTEDIGLTKLKTENWVGEIQGHIEACYQ